KNTETMDYTTVAFSATGTKINTLTFTIAPDDDSYLIDGGEFVDPLFGSFKFALSGLTPGFTDDSRDMVKIAKSGTEKVKLTFTNDDATEYKMDVMYYDSGWKLGDGTRTLYVDEPNVSDTTDANWIEKNYYFVIDSGKKSYIMKYTGYDDDDKVLSFKDMGNSEEYEMTYTGAGIATGILIIGAAQFDVSYNTTSRDVAVDLDDDGNIESGDKSVLKTSGDGQIDLSEPGNLTFTEVKLYAIGDYEPTAAALKFVVNYDAGLDEVSTVSMPGGLLGGQVESEKLYHYLSYYGSYIIHDSDADSATVYYPGNRPAYANVAIGSAPVISTTAGAAGGTYNAAIPVTNPVAKFASEVSADTTLDKNIILVGGPCANAIVKTLLNDAWNTTDSCDYWLNTHDTLKTSGNGMVKVVEDVFGSGKKALIVAGTTAADTRNLVANKVIKPTVYAGLSGSEYIGAV
ncbi:MAG: S-layer protein, partial [Candidatus Aenigmatarchaeota archaeon]